MNLVTAYFIFESGHAVPESFMAAYYHVMPYSFSALQLFTLRGHLAVYAAVHPVFLIDKLKPVGQTLLNGGYASGIFAF